MIKNRITQLSFRMVFLTFSFIGILDSFGLIASYNGQNTDINFTLGNMLFYTILSNILCFVVMLVVTISTIAHLNKNEVYGNNTKWVKMKFLTTIAIAVTFIVANFILFGMFHQGWTSLSNLTFHVVCPLLFILDFILFDAHHQVKWYDPLLSTIIPLVYCAFIYIRALLVNHETTEVIYPYFFLNIDELGISGVIVWIIILFIAFVALAYLFYLFDKIEIENGKLKFYIKKKKIKEVE